jgi:zinc protease
MMALDGFHRFGVIAAHDCTAIMQHLGNVERRRLADVEKLRQGEITQAELDKARKQARALLAYSGATVTSQAYMLAYYAHVTGDPLWLEKLEDRLMTVTVDDLHAVAQKYLSPTQRVVGWFVPTGEDATHD